MHSLAICLILATVLTSGYILDYQKDVAGNKTDVQQTVIWSESVSSETKQDFNGTIFEGPLYNTIYSVKDFLEKRNLDVQSTDGRVGLFYKKIN